MRCAMTVDSNQTTRQTYLWSLTVAAGMLLTGCAYFVGDRAAVPSERTHSMLAAARARQISLFGDSEVDRENPVVSRTAVSLKRSS